MLLGLSCVRIERCARRDVGARAGGRVRVLCMKILRFVPGLGVMVVLVVDWPVDADMRLRLVDRLRRSLRWPHRNWRFWTPTSATTSTMLLHWGLRCAARSCGCWDHNGLRRHGAARPAAGSLSGCGGTSGLPVAAGVATAHSNVFTQAAMPARRQIQNRLEASRCGRVSAQPDSRAPGQITLIAIGPLFNIQATIERDRQRFANSSGW